MQDIQMQYLIPILTQHWVRFLSIVMKLNILKIRVMKLSRTPGFHRIMKIGQSTTGQSIATVHTTSLRIIMKYLNLCHTVQQMMVFPLALRLAILFGTSGGPTTPVSTTPSGLRYTSTPPQEKYSMLKLTIRRPGIILYPAIGCPVFIVKGASDRLYFDIDTSIKYYSNCGYLTSEEFVSIISLTLSEINGNVDD